MIDMLIGDTYWQGLNQVANEFYDDNGKVVIGDLPKNRLALLLIDFIFRLKRYNRYKSTDPVLTQFISLGLSKKDFIKEIDQNLKALNEKLTKPFKASEIITRSLIDPSQLSAELKKDLYQIESQTKNYQNLDNTVELYLWFKNNKNGFNSVEKDSNLTTKENNLKRIILEIKGKLRTL